MKHLAVTLYFAFFILTFTLSLTAFASESENFKMPLNAVDSAGGEGSSESFNVNTSTGQSTPIGRSESESKIDHAGFQQPDDPDLYSISGRVYNDLNCNGQRNVGEGGLASVKLTLTPGAVDVYTGSDGAYSFTNLAAGTYVVKENDPMGYVSCTPNKKTVSIKNKDAQNINFGDQMSQ